jgi:hypothetical protein
VNDPKLKEAALRLRNLNPTLWDEFLAALAVHTDNVTAKVIFADTVTVLAAQGQAQHAHTILKFLNEISNTKPQPAPVQT